MEKFLYKDKFVELYNDKIILKCYYFPTTKSKTIPLKEIQSIYFDTQENSMVFTIGWGMTIFGVWWGFDLKRQFPSFKTKYSNVIFDTGSSAIKSGFTVVDIDGFLKALEPLLSKDTCLVNKISDKFDGKTKTPSKHVRSMKSEKITDYGKGHDEQNYVKSPYGHPPPSYEEAIKDDKICIQ